MSSLRNPALASLLLACACPGPSLTAPDGATATHDASLDGRDAGTDSGPAPDAAAPADAAPEQPDAQGPADTGDVDFTGRPIPDFLPVGSYAGITACEVLGGAPVPGLGGVAPCGSYPLALGSCNDGLQGALVTSASMFVHEELKVGNTYLGGNDLRWGQEPGHAFVMKFHTGAAGEFPPVGSLPPGVLAQLAFNFANHPNRGEVATRFATVSRTPCDFSYSRYDAKDPCYARLGMAGGGSLLLQVAPAGVAVGPGNCAVEPGTTYYLSTRWEDPDPPARGRLSCRPTPGSPTAPYCGTSLALQ